MKHRTLRPVFLHSNRVQRGQHVFERQLALTISILSIKCTFMSLFEPNRSFDWRSEFQRLDGAYAPSTMRSYYADVEAFETWCVAHAIAPFPADVGAVCAFLEAQGKTKAPSTVRRRLYAIRKVHRLLELPDPTHHEDINLSFRRVRRKKPIRPKQAKGLTRDYLDAFLASQPDTPWGLRNRAMLSLGYELLTRRSELIALQTGDLETREDGTLRVLIRRSKSDPYGAGRVAFTSVETAGLVAAWLDWRGPHIPWLFCPIYHHKALNRSLEVTAVKDLIILPTQHVQIDQR